MNRWQVDPRRIRQRLEELAAVGRDPAGGLTRFVFTVEDRQARAMVTGYMREAGLAVRVDAVGNIFGRRNASLECKRSPEHAGGAMGSAEAEMTLESAPVAAGSHIDTVRNGGRFDGTVGVVCALEVAQVLAETGVEHEIPYEVVVFTDEEGGRFGSGLLGSRALVGALTGEELRRQKDERGISAWEVMEQFGLRPADMGTARKGKGGFTCFYEVHIEQGSVLETAGCRLGVVEGIVGMVGLTVSITGEAGHAGATPMCLRRDALAGAGEIILAVERAAQRVARGGEVSASAEPTAGEVDSGAVATVGRIKAWPGASNVIPGRVELTVDLRARSAAVLDRMVAGVQEEVDAICRRRGLGWEIRETMHVPPVDLAVDCVEQIESICRERGIPYLRMPSGAVHDAQIMTRITDVGMLFVPSKGGVSHSPLEESAWDDIALAAEVLLQAVCQKIKCH